MKNKNQKFRNSNKYQDILDEDLIFYDNILLDIDNYEKWAKGLKKAGYATDPKYPKKLIDLIERYDLDKYDNLVLKRKNKTYRVKKGETLYSIAKKFDMTTENLKALNGIEENEIAVGDRIRVKK